MPAGQPHVGGKLRPFHTSALTMDENTKHVVASNLTIAYFRTVPQQTSHSGNSGNPNEEGAAYRKQAFFAYRDFLRMMEEIERDGKLSS